MSSFIPRTLLSISSNSQTTGGDINNVLDWDPATFWYSATTNSGPSSFQIKTIIPLFIDRVEFMSRDSACAYPEKWKLEGTTADNNQITLLEDKPGLCANNNYESANTAGSGIGFLCSSITVSKYHITRSQAFTSFTFTMIQRSHNPISNAIDISSVRFHGSFSPIVYPSKCTIPQFSFSIVFFTITLTK